MVAIGVILISAWVVNRRIMGLTVALTVASVGCGTFRFAIIATIGSGWLSPIYRALPIVAVLRSVAVVYGRSALGS